jgi:hypothetical protein
MARCRLPVHAIPSLVRTWLMDRDTFAASMTSRTGKDAIVRRSLKWEVSRPSSRMRSLTVS